MVALICAILVGCPVNENDITETKQSPLQSFYGSWSTSYPIKPYDDWFQVKSDDTFIYYNNGDPTNDVAYQGKIISTDLSGDYLFTNIKVTPIGRSPWGFEEGSFCRVCLKKVSDKKVQMATGFLPLSYEQTATTLDELKRKFTFENNAFSYFGEYNKK